MKLILKVKVKFKQADKDQKKKCLNIWNKVKKHLKKFFPSPNKLKNQTTRNKKM